MKKIFKIAFHIIFLLTIVIINFIPYMIYKQKITSEDNLQQIIVGDFISSDGSTLNVSNNLEVNDKNIIKDYESKQSYIFNISLYYNNIYYDINFDVLDVEVADEYVRYHGNCIIDKNTTYLQIYLKYNDKHKECPPYHILLGDYELDKFVGLELYFDYK